MWGALSDERTGLSFARVTVSSPLSVCTIYILYDIKYIYNVQKASVSPGSRLFTSEPFFIITLRGSRRKRNLYC
jgi:hypothetical protein